MLPILSNAFNDPSNPWYYVVGVLFLLLILGAVALYMFWTSKKNKSSNNEQSDVNADTPTDTAQDETKTEEDKLTDTEEQQADKE